MMTRCSAIWHTIRPATMLAYFPITLGVLLALQFSGGPTYFWDSKAGLYSVTGTAILFGPFTAAVTAHDVRQLLGPSWSQTFGTLRRPALGLLIISAANAIAACLAMYIGIAISAAVSFMLGSSVVWDNGVLLNGFPLVWLGASIGLLAGRYLPAIIGPVIAGLGFYALFLSQLRIANFEVFDIYTGTGIASTFIIYRGPILATAVACIGLAGFAITASIFRLSSLTLTCVSLMVGILGIASTAFLAKTFQCTGFQASRMGVVDLVCTGQAPRVCLPKGSEGYGNQLQEQVSSYQYVLDNLGVSGPQEYRMSWDGLTGLTGSLGGIPIQVPDTWDGRSDEDNVIAQMLSWPNVHQNCYPETEEENQREDLVRIWISQEMGIVGVNSHKVPSREEARQAYLEMQQCQLAQTR